MEKIRIRLQSFDHREMHKFAREYRDLLYELPFQVPADLLFFGRCVAILSGMCMGLYPDFNLFEGLMPFAENILKDEDEDWSKIILAWLTEQGQFLRLRQCRVLARAWHAPLFWAKTTKGRQT